MEDAKPDNSLTPKQLKRFVGIQNKIARTAMQQRVALTGDQPNA